MPYRLLLAAILLTACAPAEDPPPPADAVQVYSPRLLRAPGSLIAGEEVVQDGDCWQAPSWAVREVTGDDGTRRLLLASGQGCAADAAAADIVRDLAGDEFFLGIHRDWVVMDRGTAPDGRDLIVQNLATGETVYDGPYQHDEVAVSGSIVIFNVPIEAPDDAVCAEDFSAQGLGTGFEQVHGLNMNSGEVSAMRGVTCSPRQ